MYTKVIKMPSWMAWVQRPSGLIKMDRSGSAFRVENVSWKWILIIDLNFYHIMIVQSFKDVFVDTNP